MVHGAQEVLGFQDGQLALKHLVQMEVYVDLAHDLVDEADCSLTVWDVVLDCKLENVHGGGDLWDGLEEDGLEDNS